MKYTTSATGSFLKLLK